MLRILRTCRRAGALLIGVLLLHTSWLASSSACELRGGADLSVAATAPHATDPHAHHHTVPSPLPADPTTPLHDSSSAMCPMAMACALSAVTTDVPSVTVPVVIVGEQSPQSGETRRGATRLAPEPPPPRA